MWSVPSGSQEGLIVQSLPALVELPTDDRTVPFYTLTIPSTSTLPVHWRFASQQARATLELLLKSRLGSSRPLADLIHRFAYDELLTAHRALDEQQAWWWLLQLAVDYIREEEGLSLDDDVIFGDEEVPA